MQSRRFLNRTTILYVLAIAIQMINTSLYIIRPLTVNRDVAVLLLIGRLLKNGATPYVDFIELNPPLIYYVSTFPVFIADAFKTNPIIVFNLLVFGLLLLSSIMIVFLSSRNRSQNHQIAAATMVFIIALTTTKVITKTEFGQREHLFILLFLPYYFLRWIRTTQANVGHKNINLVCGSLAGIGILLKPHFVLIWLVLEVYWFYKSRSFRQFLGIELIIIVALGVGYLAHFLFLAPEIREGISTVIEYHRSGGYSSYGDNSFHNLMLSTPKYLVIGIAPFLIRRYSADGSEELFQSLGLFTLSSFVVYSLQGRAFIYHQIPIWFSSNLLAFCALFVIGRKLPVSKTQQIRPKTVNLVANYFPVFTYVLMVFVLFIWADIASPADRSLFLPANQDDLTQAIINYSQEESSVLVISTQSIDFVPVLEANRTLVSSYIPSFPIAFAFYNADYDPSTYDDNYPLPEMALEFINSLVEDINIYNPTMIVINNRTPCFACPPEFNMAQFLFAHKAITEDFQSRYEKLGIFSHNELYLRRD